MTERIEFAAAMKGQADSLRTAESALTGALDAVDLPPWRSGETVAIVAMGASTHSAESFVAVLRRAGVRVVNLTASDLENIPDGHQPADHYVFVSESGRSPEPIRAAERSTPGRRIAITNNETSPLTEVVDFVLPFGGIDDSRVYTTGYTATLLAYDLLARRQLGRERAPQPFDVAGLVDSSMTAYAGEAAEAAELIAGATSCDLAGRDVSLAAASEGALILREAARMPATAYETYQYLHGPMESLTAGSAVIVFGDGRELSMASSIVHRSVPTVLVSRAPAGDLLRLADESLRVIRLPGDVTGFGRAIAETVVAQLVVAGVATLRGSDIDEFLFEQPDTKLALSDG
ncbi:MAG: SIS domain-containing protein [Nocardioidaceae bacterium]